MLTRQETEQLISFCGLQVDYGLASVIIYDTETDKFIDGYTREPFRNIIHARENAWCCRQIWRNWNFHAGGDRYKFIVFIPLEQIDATTNFH